VLINFTQAASAIESFKIESPVKKLDFGVADKENNPLNADVDTLAAAMDAKKEAEPIVEVIKKEETDKPSVAPGIKAEEADEPLLQENPQRFVLFPIKYHEVRDAFSRNSDA